MTDPIARARKAVLSRFRWQDGHADVWRLFDHGPSLAAIVAGLAEPWRDRGLTRVAGIESRGFLLGAAVAVDLGLGFLPIRKGDGLFSGPKLRITAEADYRDRRHELRTQAVLGPADRVLLVDDWAERGSQARAARLLVESAGSTLAGLTLIVDQLEPGRRVTGAEWSLHPSSGRLKVTIRGSNCPLGCTPTLAPAGETCVQRSCNVTLPTFQLWTRPSWARTPT